MKSINKDIPMLLHWTRNPSTWNSTLKNLKKQKKVILQNRKYYSIVYPHYSGYFSIVDCTTDKDGNYYPINTDNLIFPESKMPDNIEEAKELIKLYRSITLNMICMSEDRRRSSPVSVVAKKLTGFSDIIKCKLCRKVTVIIPNCMKCIYMSIESTIARRCLSGIAEETYYNILFAATPEDLLEAFKKRADFIEEFLKQNYNVKCN